MPYTTIRIKTDVRDKLRALGKMGESYNEVISRLIDLAAAASSETETHRSTNLQSKRQIFPSDLG
jgi:predicted CopG family antitoxin